MSHAPLTYCCSNPECHAKFTLEQAKHAEGLIHLTAKGSGKPTPWTVSVIHLLCPECNTIAATIHVSSDPL